MPVRLPKDLEEALREVETSTRELRVAIAEHERACALAKDAEARLKVRSRMSSKPRH